MIVPVFASRFGKSPKGPLCSRKCSILACDWVGRLVRRGSMENRQISAAYGKESSPTRPHVLSNQAS